MDEKEKDASNLVTQTGSADLPVDKSVAFLPNVGDLLFVGVCQLLLFMRPNYIFSDGSTGWHLVSGNFILDKLAVPRVDIMSYTFPGKTWVAYEWLSDALMSLLVRLGGLNLLALCTTLAIAALVLSLYQRMRGEGARFTFCVSASIIGLLASANHWLVRPHLFTFWGVYLFYTRLEDFYRGKRSARSLLLWLFAVMLVWVNTHPAFLLGFAILGVYLLATGYGAIADKDVSPKSISLSRLKVLALAFPVVGLATLANPYGLQLYEYIRDYLHGTAILAATDEFKPPVFGSLSLHAICLEILFLLTAIGFYRGGRLTLPSFLLLLSFSHMALTAVRNISLFSIISLPILGRLFKKEGGAASKLDQFDAQEKLSDKHILPVLYCLIALVMAFSGAMKSGFDPESQPTTTLDYIASHKLLAKGGFSLDNWGGILRYKLDMPVFIDDRADFYGEKFYQEYGVICETRPGFLELLDKNGINWILFPQKSTLVEKLKADKTWKAVCEDQASTLLLRESAK